MIITITMNPSMDYAYQIPNFELGSTNRFAEPVQSVGGKGINAGRTAALSGSSVKVTGFLAGEQGNLVQKYLEQENLFEIDMLATSGKTRNAISIMHDRNFHTEIVEEGPRISQAEANRLFEQLKISYQNEDVALICISGSVNSSNDQFYLDLLTRIRQEIDAELPIFMDISGDQLSNLLKADSYKPTFIKPNIPELAEILGKDLTTKEEALQELSNPLFDGIDYILISCGSEGGLCKMHGRFYDIAIPKIQVRNTTGSGDASVGGFMHALVSGKSDAEIMKYSMACGMSNAQHGEVGVIDQASVAAFCQQIQVTEIKLSEALV